MRNIKPDHDELVFINKNLLVKLLAILSQIMDSEYVYVEAKPISWEEGLLNKKKVHGYQ